MTSEPPGEVTRLLQSIQQGDREARDRLVGLVYDELRGTAAGLLYQEGKSHTFQPTALVHEAYLRLDRGQVLSRAPDRHYFFAAAAQAMRQVLVDHARSRRAEKRGNGRQRVALDAVLDTFHEENLDVVALHEALDELAQLNERQSQVVILRFFGGFTVAEVSEQLGISVSTVESDFRLARAWLHRRIKRTSP
jgi:RNA polymerase sigma factor (TIGR02999 family)